MDSSEDSDIPSLRADVFNLKATREEIALLFGSSQAGQGVQDEASVRFAKQIVLSPFSAKRFAALLDKEIQNYEAAYGPLKEDPPGGTPGLDGIPLTHDMKGHLTGESGGKADRLMRLIDKLHVHYGFENSFKILNQVLLGKRFLVGFKKDTIEGNPLGRLTDVCTGIHMPGDFLEMFCRQLPESNIILFGYEENEQTSVYKAYLEFGGGFERVVRDNPQRPAPFLIHLGFKWDASDNRRRALARYTCYPSFSIEIILARLADFFQDDRHRAPLDIAKGIVALASQRMRPDEFLYLEVEEENNPRRSFDINMYRANLELQELYPWLLKMHRHYAIPSPAFHSLYDPVKSQVFGHLSGGIDREGRDFLTVYFGVKGSSR